MTPTSPTPPMTPYVQATINDMYFEENDND